MRLLRRSGLCILAAAAGFAALSVRPAVLRDLVIEGPGHRMAIGAVRAPLWSAAFAQAADSFTLDNVEVTFGSATYRAGEIVFSGVTTPRAEIEVLFSATASGPIAERLARIDAKRITIPDLKVTQKLGPKTETVTYRNVEITDVTRGRIAQATASAAGAELAEDHNRTLFSYGRITVSDFDLPAFAGVYETKAAAASGPLTKIYGAFSIDDMDIVDGDGGTDVSIARMSGRDFMARATRESWSGTLSLFSELADNDKLSDADQNRLVVAAADFFGAFDVGTLEATGITVRAKPKEAAPVVTSKIRRMAYASATGGQPSDARVEGLEVTEPDSRVSIDTISFTGFSFASTLEGLKKLEGRSLKNLDAATLRSLVPTIGTIRVSGVDIDAPNKEGPKKPGMAPERIKANLGEFAITAEEPVHAVPTQLRFGIKDFAMALPEKSRDDGIRDLIALGYRAIDMSFALSAQWNEAARELSLKDVSLSGKDMGSIALTGLFGDVSRDVFDPDTAVAAVALLGARAKAVDLTIDNDGLFQRYLAKAAKEQKTTPEALRRTYAAGAAVVIPAMIGNSEQAKTLSQAVSRFIAKPGRLVVHAEAKDAGGLGIADIAALGEPAAILDKLAITAKTE